MTNEFDAIVIGGGAAGLMAAGTAASFGKRIAVLEQNSKMGRKLLITGKGRCNVTNNCSAEEFLQNVNSNSKFLYSAAHRFSPSDTMRFYEKLGVPLKTERGGRVFPMSDRAADIVDALTAFAKQAGVIFYEERCASLIVENGLLKGILTENKKEYLCGKIVIATGGKSYPLTGSTGDGYLLAEQAGHHVVPPRASLVPVITQEKWCRECMGLSLKNVTLALREKGKKKPVYEELGEMLFTHFGISGPLVLTATSFMKKNITEYDIEIDLKPGLSAQQLEQRILRDFEKYSNREFFNALGELLPRKLIPVIVNLSGIQASERVNQITKVQREKLVTVIKHLPLTPVDLLPIDQAIITAGGVDVREINPQTMESKRLAGLFFIGEVLDLDAKTGGFNLQIAFSTGYVAGETIGRGVR